MPRATVERHRARPRDHAIACVVVALVTAWLVGPSLGRGLYLYRDFVTVPEPVLGAATWGSEGVPPRAAPLDAVTVALSSVVSTGVQQQALLVLCLVLAGAGAAALVRSFGLAAMVVAGVLAVWNPFVAERLLLGQPPTLLAYSAMPWLVLAVRSRRGPWTSLLLVALAALPAALTPWGGLSAGAVVLTTATMTRRRRGWWLAGAGVLVVLWCLPWVVPSIVHGAGGADPDGAAAFAAAPDTPLGTLWSVLTLGGVWAPGARPASRETVVAMGASAALLGLVTAGLVWLWRLGHRRPALWLGAALLVPPLAVWALSTRPGVRVFAELQQVPGVALGRDTHRWLAPAALAAAVLAGVGAAAAVHRLRGAGVARVALGGPAVVAVALGVMSVPDLPGLLHTAYRPGAMPPGWAAMVEAADHAAGDGRVLVLPWSTFRQLRGAASADTGAHPFLDPLPRGLRQEVVTSRELVVVRDGKTLRVDDDPRQSRALVAGRLDPTALAREGIAAVVVWRDTPGPATEVSAQRGLEQVLDHGAFSVWVVTRPAA